MAQAKPSRYLWILCTAIAGAFLPFLLSACSSSSVGDHSNSPSRIAPLAGINRAGAKGQQANPTDGSPSIEESRTQGDSGSHVNPSFLGTDPSGTKPSNLARSFESTQSLGVGGISAPKSALTSVSFGSGNSPLDSTPQEEEADSSSSTSSVRPSQSPHFEPVFSRWFARGNPVGGIQPMPYRVNEEASPLNPYRQNKLKGDFPILGTEDVFLNITLTNRFIANTRTVPIGTSIAGPKEEFFGDNNQEFIRNDLAFTLDLFKGQQAFKPVDWRLKITPVLNNTRLGLEERGGVNIDVSAGKTRPRSDWALQEALFEYHLFDLNDRYDFVTAEVGILPFRSDFRGFVFEDSNLGARIFGNADENKWQYNLVYYDLLDKDTNSELTKFEDRDQTVLIANLYRQDWPVLGYITSLSYHFNHDDRELEFDDNDILIVPAPIGSAAPNEIKAHYLGWAGEGHLGRFNVTHAFYQVLGDEQENALAGQGVDINAQFAALEVSYDIDWWRIRVFGLYASGDDDPRDDRGEGFDSIADAPNFAGGEFSYFNSQVIPLLGTKLTNGLSPLPNLKTNKLQGQSNFVNPGLNLAGMAFDFELTPTWRAQIGASYLFFDTTETLETFLELEDVDREIGTEIFFGTQWRPLLTNNLLLTLGASALFPGEGLQRIYESDDTLYSVFLSTILTW